QEDLPQVLLALALFREVIPVRAWGTLTSSLRLPLRLCAKRFGGSEPHAEIQEDVEVLHVGVVLELQDVAPVIVPLDAQAGLEYAAAAGIFQGAVGGGEEAADHVGTVPQLVRIQALRAPAAAAVHADLPVQPVAVVGRPQQVVLAAEAEVDGGPVQALDRHR